MTNYFRITAYYPEDNFCFIMDSNGKFEKMWQFSSYLINKGMKILEVSNDEKFLDINIERANVDNDCVILRANADGKPQEFKQIIDGKTYRAIKVGDKSYIPNKEEIL